MLEAARCSALRTWHNGTTDDGTPNPATEPPHPDDGTPNCGTSDYGTPPAASNRRGVAVRGRDTTSTVAAEPDSTRSASSLPDSELQDWTLDPGLWTLDWG